MSSLRSPPAPASFVACAHWRGNARPARHPSDLRSDRRQQDITAVQGAPKERRPPSAFHFPRARCGLGTGMENPSRFLSTFTQKQQTEMSDLLHPPSSRARPHLRFPSPSTVPRAGHIERKGWGRKNSDASRHDEMAIEIKGQRENEKPMRRERLGGHTSPTVAQYVASVLAHNRVDFNSGLERVIEASAQRRLEMVGRREGEDVLQC
ncbi:hypothetical protein B0H13DRAFT_2462894 [Mycena leptocephala]|nr:hypothetical protein B0H13DRAFT_2462894 [Mycena leptocephala]